MPRYGTASPFWLAPHRDVDSGRAYEFRDVRFRSLARPWVPYVDRWAGVKHSRDDGSQPQARRRDRAAKSSMICCTQSETCQGVSC